MYSLRPVPIPKHPSTPVRPAFSLPFAPSLFYHLQAGDDGSSILVGLGLSTKITSQGLAISKGVEDSFLDADSVLLKTHVSQHHDGR